MKMLVAVAFILFISTAVAVAPPSYNHHEWGTGHGGTGETGTGVWERVHMGDPYNNSKWRTERRKH